VAQLVGYTMMEADLTLPYGRVLHDYVS